MMTGSKGDVLVNLFTVQEGEARTIRLPQRPAVRLAGLTAGQFRLGSFDILVLVAGEWLPMTWGRGTPLQREQGMRAYQLALPCLPQNDELLFIQNRRNDVCWQREATGPKRTFQAAVPEIPTA